MTKPEFWKQDKFSLVEKRLIRYNIKVQHFGGDLASTGITKPKVHAEYFSSLVKKTGIKLVANDNNYALAA